MGRINDVGCTHTHTQTDRPTTVTLAAHARRGLIYRKIVPVVRKPIPSRLPYVIEVEIVRVIDVEIVRVIDVEFVRVIDVEIVRVVEVEFVRVIEVEIARVLSFVQVKAELPSLWSWCLLVYNYNQRSKTK